jgi:hypothetical protein
MASILKVDDLRGNTSAGDITITSEGGSATMQLQQGLAKVWANLDGGTNTIRDSLNLTSMTDLGSGRPQIDFNNNMNNDDYSVPFNTGGHNGVNKFDSLRGLENGDFTTAKCSFYTGAESNTTHYDSSNVHSSVFGDLA